MLEKIENPNEAFEIAKKLCEEVDEPGETYSKYHGGRKKHPGYGRYSIKPLKGASAKISARIRMVVALRYSGFSDVQIEKGLGLYAKCIWNDEVRHPEAFAQAKSELVKAALEEYHANVAFARAAISEMGFKALETLFDLMNKPSTPDGIRLKAAEKVLTLTFGAKPTDGQVAVQAIDKMGTTLIGLVNASKGNTYIHDAEEVQDAEYSDTENANLAIGT
jgi:hypothetical protein